MDSQNRNDNEKIKELEDLLCWLAMEWRSKTANRQEIKEKYRSTVMLLFSLGWDDYVDWDCELPTEDMPQEYFERQANKPESDI